MSSTENQSLALSEKVVSVSLFGERRKYLTGATDLIRSVNRNLPGWKTVFFVGSSVPAEIRNRLSNLGGRIIPTNDPEGLSAASWRFRIGQIGNPGWVIFRDSDSVISIREAHAVNQWIDSGLPAHIIRDHPFHSAPILAGLWGLRPPMAAWFTEEVQVFQFSDVYGSDQDFLANNVYPRIANASLIHTSFHRHERGINSVDFDYGNSRTGPFCGESISSNLVARIYARFRRLVDPKECQCGN